MCIRDRENTAREIISIVKDHPLQIKANGVKNSHNVQAIYDRLQLKLQNPPANNNSTFLKKSKSVPSSNPIQTHLKI